MKLYSGPLSMFGAKAEIAVHEKDIDCEIEHVGFSIAQLYKPYHPEVVRINPKCEVPVLIDGDLEIYDSTQVFEYFESIKPEPALWPAEPKARARARLLELASDEVFFPCVVLLMPARRAASTEEEVEEGRKRLHAFYAERDALLADRPFFAGEAITYADIAFYMAGFFAWFLGEPASDELTRLADWRTRMGARPAVKKVAGTMKDYLESQGIPAQPV